MKPSVIVGALCCALILGAAGCGDDESEPAQGAATGSGKMEKVTLQLSWIPKEEYGFLYAGQEAGIFKKHGIDLQFATTQGSTAAMQVLGTKKVDFLISGGPSLFSVVDEGLALKMVALYLRSTPSMLLAWPDSGVKTINDLSGKSIILTPGDGFTPSWPCVASENGIDESSVDTLSIGVAARAQAFAAHKADVIPWYATSSIAAVEKPAKTTFVRIPGSDYKCGQILGNGLITREDVIQDNPDLVKRMVAAVTESWDAAVADPASAAKAIQPKLPGSDYDDVLSVIKTTNSLGESPNTKGKPTGWMSDKDWQASLDVMTNSGVIKDPKPLDTYYTNEFIPGS